MKISSTKELHSVVKDLQTLLDEKSIKVKTSRLIETFSKCFQYNSANHLISSLPRELEINSGVGYRLSKALVEIHGAREVDGLSILQYLERSRLSYSSKWRSDSACYPKSLPKGINYWYLTADGWFPWDQMDLEKQKVELDIYKVAQSGRHWLGGSVSSIWDAQIAGSLFEAEARRLEGIYGDLPSTEQILSG